MSADEAEREALMARMKAAGLGGQMYNRDDIMSQVGSSRWIDTWGPDCSSSGLDCRCFLVDS